MSFQLLYFIIIINQIYLLHSSQIVSLPFNSFFKYGNRTNISSIDDLSRINLYSKINIGEPLYEIKAFLSVQHSYFSINKDYLSKNINDFFTHYNIKKSNSFKNVSTNISILGNINYDSVATEKFELNIYNYIKKEYYNISLDDMIIIYNDNDKNDQNILNTYYLNIGFQIINQKKYKEREQFNFINQLKKKNIIQRYDWCIFFQKGKNNNGSFLYNPNELINAKGEILIGDLPNNYNSNFHSQQLLSTYSIFSDSLYKWALEFSNVYYNKSLNEIKKIHYTDVQLNINSYVILSPMIYYYNIKNDYFDYYLSKKICKIYQGDEYKTFYCEKSENFTIDDLKKFPTLYMEHKEFEYIFEFTYEDLFIEKDNNYWFLVALSVFNNDLEEWFMGIIFLRKYNLIFNQDSKTISFYNPNKPISSERSETNNNNNNNIGGYNSIIIIFIIIIIIFAILLILIFCLFFKKNAFKSNKDKRRLNHIHDNLDNNNINKKNDNKNNNNNDKYALLDMDIN